MYAYDEVDQHIVDARVEEFRDQVRRFRAGKLTDDEFLALRLRNGLYRQRHAYMLRVAIPYGTLSSDQMRMLAHIARTWDKGYGHFTTRQNIQYNWPELDDVPDILAALASVQMHAIQTSGNCVRNTTADHLAGLTPDEPEDPRPYAEMIRQWSTLNPEFNWLPRKFKIAITGRHEDGAAIAFHDIGLRLVRNDHGETRFEVYAGGGLGRTPVVASKLRDDLHPHDLLAYIDAILRVYNRGGNRKNKFKARIKIQVRTMGVDAFREAVEREFARLQGGPLTVTDDDIERYRSHFVLPKTKGLLPAPDFPNDPAFEAWRAQNVLPHKRRGYAIAYLSLKPEGVAPGDLTADQMDAVADLADRFSFGEIRTTHDQNLLFPHVEQRALYTLWQELQELTLATPNRGLLTDSICCPGLDFCNLANTPSIPLAKEIAAHFSGSDKLLRAGEIQLKMSGCINACGHHHAGHIGILGVDKKGEHGYQLLLGGSAGGTDASIGKWIGRALSYEQVAPAIERMIDTYLDVRASEEERFIDAVRRLGPKPFAAAVYDPLENDEEQPGATA